MALVLPIMNALSRTVLLAAVICACGSVPTIAQTPTVIPAKEAAQHLGQHVTVEGVVAKSLLAGTVTRYWTSEPLTPTNYLLAGYRKILR